MRAKLAALDAGVAPWVARMLDTHPGLRVLLVADHGMATMARCVALQEVLGPTAEVFSQGGSALVHLEDAAVPAAEARLTALGLRGWRPEGLPECWHLSRSARLGSLVVQAPVGTWLPQSGTARGRKAEWRRRRGAHGYDASEPQMHGWLVALGTGRRGPLPPTPLWDLAPTVAAWLGLAWAQPPDGTPVAALGA